MIRLWTDILERTKANNNMSVLLIRNGRFRCTGRSNSIAPLEKGSTSIMQRIFVSVMQSGTSTVSSISRYLTSRESLYGVEDMRIGSRCSACTIIRSC